MLRFPWQIALVKHSCFYPYTCRVEILALADEQQAFRVIMYGHFCFVVNITKFGKK